MANNYFAQTERERKGEVLRGRNRWWTTTWSEASVSPFPHSSWQRWINCGCWNNWVSRRRTFYSTVSIHPSIHISCVCPQDTGALLQHPDIIECSHRHPPLTGRKKERIEWRKRVKCDDILPLCSAALRTKLGRILSARDWAIFLSSDCNLRNLFRGFTWRLFTFIMTQPPSPPHSPLLQICLAEFLLNWNN